MLPFLQKNKDASTPGVIVKHRAPDEKPESDEDDPSAAKEACGQAIIDAIRSGNAMAVAEACQDMYDMCQSSPESEPSPHSYDAQNQQAGE